MKIPSRVHLKSGIDSVGKAKFRSFWTMLGIIIGVTSVITVVGIGEGIKQEIGGQIHHLGQNLITIRPARLTAGNPNSDSADNLSGLAVSGTLGNSDVNVVSQSKAVAASAPLTITPGIIKGDNGRYADGFVVGTSSQLPSLLNQSLAFGNFFGDQDNGNNVAVLGQHASEAMFNEDVPLGRSFTFHGQSFIVDGIFNDFTTPPLNQQVDLNNAIFIPNDVAESLTNNTAPTYEILARPAKNQSTDATIISLKAALNKAHGGPSGLSIVSGNQDVTASNGILELLTRLIAGVAAVSLLVGGIGIMDVMMVSVSERTHEIGIRKAVGATNRQILSQFMLESTLLSLIGGLIGVVLAFLIDISLRAFTDLRPSISWQIIVLATGVSFLVGLVFGTIPAIKAASKNPIEALRNE